MSSFTPLLSSAFSFTLSKINNKFVHLSSYRPHHFTISSSLTSLLSIFSASGPESEASPEKRPRTEEEEEGDEVARSQEEAPGGSGPKQKNRRRCYRCQTKLELVQQELGSCRCGQYFILSQKIKITYHFSHCSHQNTSQLSLCKLSSCQLCHNIKHACFHSHLDCFLFDLKLLDLLSISI